MFFRNVVGSISRKGRVVNPENSIRHVVMFNGFSPFYYQGHTSIIAYSIFFKKEKYISQEQLVAATWELLTNRKNPVPSSIKL